MNTSTFFHVLLVAAALFLMASASGLAWLQLDTWFHAELIFGLGFFLLALDFLAHELELLASAYFDVHFTDEAPDQEPTEAPAPEPSPPASEGAPPVEDRRALILKLLEAHDEAYKKSKDTLVKPEVTPPVKPPKKPKPPKANVTEAKMAYD